MSPSPPLLLLLAPLLVTWRLPFGAAHAVVIIDARNDEAISSLDVAANTSAFLAAESLASAASAWNAEDLEVGEDAIDWQSGVSLNSDIPIDFEVEESQEADTQVQLATMRPNFTVDAPILPNGLDSIIDFALQALAYEIKKNKSAEIAVPDLNKEFRIRIGLIKVHGHFSASGGVVGDLTSLFRDGAVAVHPQAQGGKVLLDGVAGLRLVRVRFRRYTARAGPIRVSGSLEAQVAPATVRGQLLLTPPCSAQLHSLAVGRVGPLRLRVTGLGVLRRLLPTLQRWFEKRMREDVERLVVQRLSDLIRAQLRLFRC